MSESVPIGQVEGQRLEFKGARALENLDTILQNVVGMRNANGGDVWIGVIEKDEAAIGVEPIAEVARECRRLEDATQDRISPKPQPGEITANRVDVGAAGAVIRVSVKARGRDERPAALLGSEGSRRYPVRVGARLRPMTDEEIFGPRAHTSDVSSRDGDRRAELLRLRDAHLGEAGNRLWFAVAPGWRLRDRFECDPGRLRSLVWDPQLSRNRELGFHPLRPSAPQPETREDSTFVEFFGGCRLEIHVSGRITFVAPLRLMSFPRDPFETESREIWPIALMELPISLLRLAATLYREKRVLPLGGDATVLVDFALVGAEQWTLGAHSPRSLGYRFEPPHRLKDTKDFQLSDGPQATPWKEFVENPDAAFAGILTRVYRAFNWDESAIPAEFDRAARRLNLT